MKKRILIAFIVVFVLVSGILVSAKMFSDSPEWGLFDIRMSGNRNALSLEIDYADCYGYRVESVEEDEVVYHGERPVALDPALGKYVIKIFVGDAPVDKSFSDEHAPWEVYDLYEDAGIRAMWYPLDHGVVIYVGADQPLTTEFHEIISLRNTKGTLFIPIEISEEK